MPENDATETNINNTPTYNNNDERSPPTTNTISTAPSIRRNNTNNTRNFHSFNPITFEGDTKEIGVVVGLKMDKFHKKVPFETFAEKLQNYVISNFKHGADLQPIFYNLSDPKPILNRKICLTTYLHHRLKSKKQYLMKK